MESKIHSVFSNTHVNADGIWITELNFYEGDLSSVDVRNDWRFKMIPNQRNEALFLGLYDGGFPVHYPFQFINGSAFERPHGDYVDYVDANKFTVSASKKNPAL